MKWVKFRHYYYLANNDNMTVARILPHRDSLGNARGWSLMEGKDGNEIGMYSTLKKAKLGWLLWSAETGCKED